METRERLLTAAMELFQEKGYNATSVADILAKAGANSGSLYHFFPTKQEVLLAVLDGYLTGISRMLLEPAWGEVEDPIEKVFALLERYREALVATDCTYGCPIGSLALELHEPDPPVRERLAANFEAWVDAVAACLEAAGPRLPMALDRRDLATFALTTMEGGVMLSRTHRNLASYDAAVRSFRSYLAHLQAAASTAT
ncbi:MAG TPA: TetR/AcrR family transcriptional regulator [Longimicrobiaceae bacterium]